MATIVVSAPGKVILHGEHAVVYGKRALAGSLGLKTTLRLQPTNDDRVTICLSDIGINVTWNCDDINTSLCSLFNGEWYRQPVEATAAALAMLKKFVCLGEDAMDTRQLGVVAFLYLFCSITATNRRVPSAVFTIKSELPTSAGLGSSAAYSTCLAASLLVHSGRTSHSDRLKGHTPSGDFVIAELSASDLVNADSFQTTCLSDGSILISDRLHSVGTLNDVCVSDGVENGCRSPEHSGVIKFTTRDLELINQWSFMAEKIIHGRPSGIDNSVSTYGGALSFQNGTITPLLRVPEFHILLINTKVARSTKDLVEGVRRMHDKYPEIVNPVLDSIEGISRRCESLLTVTPRNTEHGHTKTLEDLIDMNQQLLRFLGVSHASVDNVCSIAARYALHAKLTGAGGGGCVFALLTSDIGEETIAKVTKEMCDSGFDCFKTLIGGDGVTARMHSST